jgi:hypothetical protein
MSGAKDAGKAGKWNDIITAHLRVELSPDRNIRPAPIDNGLIPRCLCPGIKVLRERSKP